MSSRELRLIVFWIMTSILINQNIKSIFSGRTKGEYLRGNPWEIWRARLNCKQPKVVKLLHNIFHVDDDQVEVSTSVGGCDKKKQQKSGTWWKGGEELPSVNQQREEKESYRQSSSWVGQWNWGEVEPNLGLKWHQSILGLGNHYELAFLLDKRYNSVALVQ